MLNGKSEWTDSIMAQVHRSTGLINELITLSRMSEAHEAVFEDVDLTEEVTEAAESFRTLILQQGKKLETEIMPKVTVRAERAFSAELINILLDNAAKYCDDGGTVRVELKKKGRAGALLRVQNDYRDGADVDYSRLFQRFYREDSSHNSKKSGYGIGLAMAQTIMERVKGSINAYWKDGVVTFTVIYQ
jgi:signal transduction histidine kinase